MENPDRPVLIILGGAKVKDKLPLIKNLLKFADEIIIGGGMAFTFLKESQKIEIGKSLFDKESIKEVIPILLDAESKGVKIHFPVDFQCGKDAISVDDWPINRTLSEGIPEELMGLDIGTDTIN